MIELYVVSWMPADSIPRNDGWNNDSGQRKRSFPIYLIINDFQVGIKALLGHYTHLTVWEFIRLFQSAGRCCSLHFLLEVERHITQLLLDVTNNFSFGGSSEAVTPFSKDFH
ncbi:Acetolactate synthase small subunit [Aphis craccivora]|uniref:Acetolactate synthase small subunit n=1 Tax=Aphis craccivora TaxID=307492 RepID=A0A6G0YKG3_APHCR|nr:Acetolactate synthase small subunit [Aphis craccivora]